MGDPEVKNKYSFSDYDRQLCLKFNDTLWIILVFLLRPYLISIASLANRKDKMGVINFFYPDKTSLVMGILAGLPAALVIFAWMRKKPDAASVIRKIWHRGRELLAASALLNAMIVLVPYLIGRVHRIDAIGWVQLAVSVSIIPVVYFSAYIRDCFADYPKEQPEEGVGAKGR